MTSLDLLARVLLGVIAALTLWWLAPVLTPILISGLLAYLGSPIVRAAARRRIPRPLTALALFMVFFAVIVSILLWVVPMVEREISAFGGKVPQYFDWLQARLAAYGLHENVAVLKAELLRQWQDIGHLGGQALSFATQSSVRIIDLALNVLMVPVMTFYLLRDWDVIVKRVYALVPARLRPRALSLAREIDQVLGGFLRGQLLVMIALSAIYSIGLMLTGLDLALPIGLTAGLLSFIPYFGFFTGVILATLAAVFQFHTWGGFLGVLLVFGVGEFMESMVLVPRLVGERVGMHPVAVIFALLAGGYLFGFFGLLLAVPVAAVLVVWIRFLYRDYVNPPRLRRMRP